MLAYTYHTLFTAMQANYFFRLSKYQKEIEALLTKEAGFVKPDSRRNEVGN